MRTKLFTVAMGVVAVVMFSAIAVTFGQMGMQGEKMDQQPMTEQQLKQDCMRVQEKMKMMQQECDKADQELQQKVTAMNEATGQAKIDAMAEAITMMVQQRMDMRKKGADMMEMMMQHMAKHMAMGMNPEAAKMMMMCPMMHDMGMMNHKMPMMQKPAGGGY